jgi:threonine dehydrogenase-like Zn-dependent dehydrogenase
MKAGVKLAEGAGNFEVTDIDTPTIGDDEVLVQIKTACVCGSDVLLHQWRYRGRFPVEPPVVLGHEGAGVIEDMGKSVKGLNKGDRVVVESILGCGSCYYCHRGWPNLCPQWQHLGISRDGTFAEYIKLPMKAVHKLPDSVSFEDGAMVEPLGIVVNAFERIRFSLGDSIVIIGPGTLGLLTAQAARSFGASKVIVLGLQKDELRMNRIRELGADVTIVSDRGDPAAQVLHLTDGMGADIVMEAGGTKESFDLAFDLVRGRGQIVAIGYAAEGNIAPVKYARQELAMFGVCACTPRHYEEAIKWLQHGKVSTGAIVSHRFDLSEAEKGIKMMGDKEATKVSLTP